MLLILAGVSILMLTGENGILTQAQRASEETQIAEEKEAINLAMQSLLIDKHINPDNYENGIISATQLRGEMDKSNPKPANVSLDSTNNDLIVTFDESRNNRTYTVGQDGTIKSEGAQQPVQTTSFYAKLYTYTDGSGDVLELSSNPDFTDTSRNVTLKEDYGDIGANHYYMDYNESYTENESYYEETGLMPPWLEKTTEEYEEDGYKETSTYYVPNEDIIEVKIVDKIEPTYTSYLFYNLSSLENIESIENIDTKNTIDMEGMFCNCEALTTLDLSDFDTSNVTNMSGMFNACVALTTLNVSNFNTSNVTDMSRMFNACVALTTLNVSNFNTSNVTDMSSMFMSCGLTTLNVSNWNTSNVTYMISMFSSCGLTTLDVSNWNTSNVKAMNQMFCNCENLQTLNLSNWDVSKITDMSQMFRDCTNLMSVNLNGWNTSNVTNMEYMFGFCTSLTDVNLDGWNTSNVTNMKNMFFDCTSLTSLDISSFDISSDTNTYSMFCNVPGVVYVKNATIKQILDGVVTNIDGRIEVKQ